MLAVTLRENALTTLDALKTSLGIDPAEEDAQRDATLVQLINAASAWLETQLGRKLGKSTYRQRYCGTGTQQLSLEQYPIVSVERITDTFTGKTITDFDFNETGEIGVLFREDGWTYRGHIGGLAYDYIAPRKYLEVQYVAGYILPKDATEDHPATLPADLEAIVWYMIAQQWANIENDAAGLSAFSISDVSWTFDKNISETWQSVIAGVHEYGATISAKNVKHLAIPLNMEAKNAGSPRKFNDLRFIPISPGYGFLVRDRKHPQKAPGRKKQEKHDAKKHPSGGEEDPRPNEDYEWMYMLVDSVTIPERSFIRASFDTGKATLENICKEAVDGIILKKWTAQEAADYIGKWAVEMTHDYFNSPCLIPGGCTTAFRTAWRVSDL